MENIEQCSKNQLVAGCLSCPTMPSVLIFDERITSQAKTHTEVGKILSFFFELQMSSVYNKGHRDTSKLAVPES